MTREWEQVGKEEEETQRDKERVHIRTEVSPLRGKEEKWRMAISLGKFIAKNRTIAGKKERKNKEDSHIKAKFLNLMTMTSFHIFLI